MPSEQGTRQANKSGSIFTEKHKDLLEIFEVLACLRHTCDIETDPSPLTVLVVTDIVQVLSRWCPFAMQNCLPNTTVLVSLANCLPAICTVSTGPLLVVWKTSALAAICTPIRPNPSGPSETSTDGVRVPHCILASLQGTASKSMYGLCYTAYAKLSGHSLLVQCITVQ